MVEQVENPANKLMHYGTSNVGVIKPPDRLPRVVVYSPFEAEKEYNKMQFDLYQSEKKTKKYEKHKFPMILKIIGGIIVASALFVCRKEILKPIKALFKRHPKVPTP